MNKLTKDFIAIDTNIFEHLLNPQENINRHIDQLLNQLSDDSIKLLVDNEKKITKEYKRCLDEMIDRMEDDYRKLLLLYWMDIQNQKSIKVSSKDALMRNIKKIIPLGEGSVTDCFFVYVAFKEGRILITNDRGDMIDEGTQIGERRRKLLKIGTKNGRKKGSDILTSQQAYDRLQGDMIKSQANYNRRN